MKLRITLFYIFTTCLGFSQDLGQITIVGRVADTDNVPLIGATVLDTSTSKGSITDKQGIFHLILPKQGTTIRISYVGYHTLEKTITAREINDSKNDTILFSVSLKPKTVELAEVEILAANIQRAYNKPEILIIDYDFHSDGLFLLLSINNQYKLRMVDDYSNTLNDIPIRKKPENLFRDCFGNLHILYADSIYQIRVGEAGLSLMDGFSVEQFTQFLLPCVAACNDVLFFKDHGLHNQSVIYYLIEKTNKEKKLVQVIVDEESLIAVDDFYQEIMAEGGAPNTMGENKDQHQVSRKVEKKIWFYQIILSSPIYNPLCQVKDSIFIFNHIVDSAFVYNGQGELQRTFPINYHYQAGWKNEVLIDYTTQEIYAKCVRGGLVYLLQIDPNSGQILDEFRLNGHVYPEKIKVRDGVAYYLHKDNKEFSVQNVYRQRLK